MSPLLFTETLNVLSVFVKNWDKCNCLLGRVYMCMWGLQLVGARRGSANNK